jgi:hypothetical protein
MSVTGGGTLIGLARADVTDAKAISENTITDEKNCFMIPLISK